MHPGILGPGNEGADALPNLGRRRRRERLAGLLPSERTWSNIKDVEDVEVATVPRDFRGADLHDAIAHAVLDLGRRLLRLDQLLIGVDDLPSVRAVEGTL